jgi:hypothetical protein
MRRETIKTVNTQAVNPIMLARLEKLLATP